MSNFSKRVQCEASCRLCGERIELDKHCFWECSLARNVWSLANHNQRMTRLANSFKFTLDHLMHNEEEEVVIQKVSILWYIWKARCSYMYEGVRPNPQHILAGANSLAQECSSFFIRRSGSSNPSSYLDSADLVLSNRSPFPEVCSKRPDHYLCFR